MSEIKIQFVKKPWLDAQRIEPSTCTEAETFVLQVLDDSMEPEFLTDCIIVVDPTGLATEGSYVLAKRPQDPQTRAQTSSQFDTEDEQAALEPYLFRQLHRQADGQWHLCPLNETYPSEVTAPDFSDIVGVIVQRAGKRRRYHKRYD